MHCNVLWDYPPQVGAISGKTIFIPPHFGKPIPKLQLAVGLLAGLLTTQAFGAQADTQTSIFSPWSDQDVRQGPQTRPDTRAVPREFVQPAAMPKDIRRSSEPSADAIPIYRKSNRDDLEDIRLGSRPESRRSDSATKGTARRDSFITLQPFSDTDLRQGSRHSSATAVQTTNNQDKPIQDQPERNKKGFFGRALEKIGF